MISTQWTYLIKLCRLTDGEGMLKTWRDATMATHLELIVVDMFRTMHELHQVADKVIANTLWFWKFEMDLETLMDNFKSALQCG